MTIYYQLEKNNPFAKENQFFIAANKTWQEIKEAVANMKCDFPHIQLWNRLGDSDWEVHAFNLIDADVASECLVVGGWETAQKTFAEAIKTAEIEYSWLPTEPKHLKIVALMQQALADNPHLLTSFQQDFLMNLNSLAKWGCERRVFVWLVCRNAAHTFWEVDDLKERQGVQSIVLECQHDNPETKVWIGHPHYDTLQEMSPQQAALFFPVNAKDWQAVKDFKPKLEDFLAVPEEGLKHIARLRAIAKDRQLEENLQFCFDRVATIAYNGKGLAWLAKDGEESLYWNCYAPGDRKIMNGGINWCSHSNSWSVNT